MVLVALSVLVVVAAGLAVGVHTGPHGLVAAGALGILASVALVVGAIEMVPSGSRPVFGWVLLAGAALVSVGAIVAGALSLPALRRRQPSIGSGRLWGADGVALTDLDPLGTVRVRGETWTAESMCGRLPAGAAVEVMEVEGLRLRVWSDAAAGDQLPAGQKDEERT
ncbi:MAG TPA: NfeD family protein [Acidimicrobiales bacterium]|nr:NfeD family protein [Acidimicrobiales bacterium]